MNIGAFFASLGAAIMTKLASVGAALALGFSTIVAAFTTDQANILLDVKTTFNTAYQANVAAGQSTVDAIEAAATTAFNEFCGDEQKEFTQECGALITLLESAAKQAAGILGTTLQTQVVAAAPAAAGVIAAAVPLAETAVDAGVDAAAAAADKATDQPTS